MSFRFTDFDASGKRARFWVVRSILAMLAVLTSSATICFAQQSTASQRPLPLPENGTSDVEHQFRMMQQLQQMVRSGQTPTESGQSPQNPTSLAELDSRGTPSDPAEKPLIDPKLIEEWTKNLNPEQRDALREAAKQFQSDLQQRNNQTQKPAQLENMLQDFLRTRKLPEPNAESSETPFPGLPSNQSPPPSPPRFQPNEPAIQQPNRQPGNTQPEPSSRPPRLGAAGDDAESSSLRPPAEFSTQQLLEQLSSNADSLPPVPPPQHVQQEIDAREAASRQEQSREMRQRAIERQNQSLRSRTNERSGAGNSTDPSKPSTSAQSNNEERSVDAESMQRFRENVRRRGLGDTLRDIFRETREEAKQEAIQEAREARQKAAEQAAKEAAEQANRTPPFPPSIYGNGSGTTRRSNENSNQPNRGSNNSNRQFSPGSGIIDEEMVQSLLGDQKRLEQMIRDLQRATAEMNADERRTPTNGADRPDVPENSSQSNTNPNTTSEAADAAFSDAGKGSTGLPNQPFDFDQADGKSSTTQAAAEQEGAGRSIAQRLANWYRDLTADGLPDLPDSTPLGNDNGGIAPSDEFQFPQANLPIVIALLLLVGLAIWWMLRNPGEIKEDDQRRAIFAKRIPASIRSREELIQAFHCVALASRVSPPTWWTHPKTAEILASTSPDARSAVYTLAQLYEIARYSPDGNSMTSDQLSRANEALVQLKGI